MPTRGKGGPRALSTVPAADARRQRFVAEYCIDQNAAQAAIRAGYSKKAAASVGQRLLTVPQVRAAITERLKQLAVRLDISAERVLQEYARIAFADPRRAVRWGMTELVQVDEDALGGTATEIAEELEAQPHGGALKRTRAVIQAGDPNTPTVRDRVPYAELVPSSELSDDDAAAIAEMSVVTTYTRQGEPKVTTKIKMHDKLAALDALAKHLQLFKDGDTNVTNITVHVASARERLESRIAGIAARLGEEGVLDEPDE